MVNQNEWEALCADYIRIAVKVSHQGTILMPDIDGKETIVAIFKKMTCEDYWNIEHLCKVACFDEMHEEEGGGAKQLAYTDYQEVKMLLLKRMLVYISIIDLKMSKNGEMTPHSFERVINLPSPLINAMLEEYETSMNIGADDLETIEKQARILFAKDSRGVENACEAVTLFCNLGNFWEKFGINRFDMKNMPYREYLMLKFMIGKESEGLQRSRAANSSKNKIGKGRVSIAGKTMPSRGIVVPDVGQRF